VKNTFEKWLKNNNKSLRHANTLQTIANDLKKVHYTNHNIFAINNLQQAQRVKEDYFNIDEYHDKNERGHNMYNSAFNRYLEFLASEYSSSNNIQEIIYPDEVESSTIIEGAKKQVTVNAYERSPKARAKCIEEYGYKCYICDFDFEKIYGELGRSFIHVHHIKPLSEIKDTYTINPIKDLRPVCPNCHAMLHKRVPAYSIEEIQSRMKG
jgi:predicted HNH restriction endonuclease